MADENVPATQDSILKDSTAPTTETAPTMPEPNLNQATPNPTSIQKEPHDFAAAVQPSQPAANRGANTSGSIGPVPDEIKGWNWGAFFWTWLWAVAHNVWIGLIALIFTFPMNIVLGIKGSEWAWQSRKFESVEQFKATQKKWTIWGWVFAVLAVIMLAASITMTVLLAPKQYQIDINNQSPVQTFPDEEFVEPMLESEGI